MFSDRFQGIYLFFGRMFDQLYGTDGPLSKFPEDFVVSHIVVLVHFVFAGLKGTHLSSLHLHNTGLLGSNLKRHAG